MGLYICLIVTLLAVAVVVASFIGPESSEVPFWKFIIRTRRILDLFSYSLFNLLALLGILTAIRELLTRPVEGDLFYFLLQRTAGLAGVLALLYTLYYSARKMIRSGK